MPALVYILLSIALAVLAPWRPEPLGGYRSGGEPLRCQPPSQLKRTFVGFPDGSEPLGNFEPAALEATRILQATKEQSCSLDEQQDAGAGLRTALGSGPVEITRVLFKSPDLTVAEVQMGPQGGPSRGARGPNWTLRVVRHGDKSWQVESSSPR